MDEQPPPSPPERPHHRPNEMSPMHSPGRITTVHSFPSGLQIIRNVGSQEDIPMDGAHTTPDDSSLRLTPTRVRSKSSVTFLASGCGVSPLNPFNSQPPQPQRMDDTSDNDNNENDGHDVHLGHSLPDFHQKDPSMQLRPIRRHTITGDDTTHSNTKSNRLTETTEVEDDEDETSTTHRSTQSSSMQPPYQYQNNTLCLKLLRRLCRPHVTNPCCRCYPLPCSKLSPRHRRLLCRSTIILFMIITIAFTLLDLLILHQYLHVWLSGCLDWLYSHPVAGGLVFICLIVLASLCFFPVSLIALGAGFVYIDLYGGLIGILAAFAVCYTGCLLGAAICFARSRYLMRQLIEKFAQRYPIVRAVDRAFEGMGFRIFLLLRLSPAMPFNALNYIGGITAVGFRDYWRATW